MIDYESMTNEELNQLAVERLNPTIGGYDASDWPDYLYSLDACLRDYIMVLDNHNVKFAISYRGSDYQVMMVKEYPDFKGHEWYEVGTNPARVFTIVFLKVEEQLANMKG